MPLPPQMDSKKILDAVIPRKMWTAFIPINVGHLVAGRPALVACTPAGVMEILRRSNIPVEGANAVVIGRSDIVGKPMALLLLHANATVTICHSKTQRFAGNRAPRGHRRRRDRARRDGHAGLRAARRDGD